MLTHQESTYVRLEKDDISNMKICTSEETSILAMPIFNECNSLGEEDWLLIKY